ncbi:MAG: transglycosylase SLT domain-containing protein [Bacteroidetes bacterium]|nr:transglycosylase SLT domain-containing protein [Bacteroidota bacterium]
MKKIPWTIIILLFATGILVPPRAALQEIYTKIQPKTSWRHHSDEAIAERMAQLNMSLDVPYHPAVRRYIRHMAVEGIRGTENMLSKANWYFPIMEPILAQADIPEEMKYLAVVESMLRLHVRSEAGAVGLWQFMGSTARHYGLKMNSYVDERKDPHKATVAAIRYFTDLYQEFGDWNLVLAAYNCGPKRVKKAIKMSGSKDYWKIRYYLPKETRNYFPRFLSAAYIMNFHHLHNLASVDFKNELQSLNSVRIYERVSFKEISEITSVDVATIRLLNPAFKRDIIPESKEGYFLLLPERAFIASLD